ncbi:MAG: hypothetical protein R3250_05870 [Melioribacteraceae bacterium]|nr:hypothetical protein [Melioribacteraceae bacterium]
MKEKKSFVLLMVLFLLSACGNEIENVKQIILFFWEIEGEEHQEVLFTNENEDSINSFIDAINHAEELGEKSVITTKPLLSFLMTLDKEKEKNYHLWITTKGEGYIQRLLPDKSATFKLDATSVKELSKLINQQEKVLLINQAIEFEK